MTDDDLRARLRNADPAAGLAPLSPGRATRLLGASLSRGLDPSPPVAARREPARSPRTTRRLRLAAAGLVLIAAAAAAGVALRSPDGTGPVPQPPASAAVVTVTRIVADGDAAILCVRPSAATLAAAPLAFAGTVERIAGGTAFLRVTHQYAGAPTTVVEVARGEGQSEALLGSTGFATGRAYLIAAAGGSAMVCGYSGVATPGLQALYDAAF